MAQKARSGFTLVEMMVVISIIGILMAIALPAISAARESARNSACASNLRQFGVALTAFAGRFGTLGSGAMDWPRDGAVTEFGWVADLVNQGAIPGEMLCRSNTNQISAAYKDLLQGNLDVDPCRPNLLGSGPKTLPNGTTVRNPCRMIVEDGLLPGPARRSLVEAEIYQRGFNTNYTASWYMVRTELRLDKNGNPEQHQSGCTLVGVKERGCTLGPLSVARLDSSGVPISHVPLLADGANAGVLPDYLGSLTAASGMAAMYTDGPVRINPTTMAAPSNPDPTPYGGMNGWWEIWMNRTLQDFRKFGAVHGGGSSATCNVLFADGSVRSFRDANGDGYLNNGFNPADAANPDVLAKMGFTDDSVELPTAEFFSGSALRR